MLDTLSDLDAFFVMIGVEPVEDLLDNISLDIWHE